MTQVVRCSAVRDRRNAMAFRDLPFRLYRHDPCWVAPLRRDAGRQWSTLHNPSLRSRETQRFLCWRDGRVVGRVAAIIDPAFADRWLPGAGFFGFFECERDPEAATSLLQMAEDWLAERGCTIVIGPVNLTTHEEVGLLVEGFTTPTLLSPYNPPWYAGLVVGAGYRAERDYHAYRWTADAPTSPAVERLLRALARPGNHGGVVVRHLNPDRWDEEVRAIHEVYDAAFEGLWGFVPLSHEEFRRRAEQFRPFYRPELVILAEVEGRPAGFGLVLPDVNQALRPLRGRLLPFGWLRLALGVRRIRSGRFLLLGVRPEHAGRGLAVLISHAMAEAGRAVGIVEAELSLVQDLNQRTRAVIESFGAHPTRTFRLYRKMLPGAGGAESV